MKKISIIIFLITFSITFNTKAQSFNNGKLLLNNDGSSFLKFTVLNQFWVRSGEYNPGSTVFGYAKNGGTDFGLRRTRLIMQGEISDRVYIYTQIGINNFNNISARKTGFFLHDAMADYAVVKNKFYLGGGLSCWSGISRFSAPSVGSIMGLDAPSSLQTTNEMTDQFQRKLEVYTKGKLGKLDYRVAIAQPMSFQQSPSYTTKISTTSNYSPYPGKMQLNGYFQYQFKDQESNQNPYTAGTYLGAKNIFNLGLGMIFQKQAMISLNAAGDTLKTNLFQISGDIFIDKKVNDNGAAISIYSDLAYLNYGKNYLNIQNPMSPTNGTTNSNILNGTGFGSPLVGTGKTWYSQAGYKMKNNLIGKTTLMPYVTMQVANFDRLNSTMLDYSAGVNWLFSGHASKLTAAIESRPIYNVSGDQIDRKANLIVQYQVMLN